jgi:DNA-binding response OmpR family regulator
MTTESTVLTPRPSASDARLRAPAGSAHTGRTVQAQADGTIRADHEQEADGESPEALTFENLELRPDEMQALVGGTRVGFTVREYQVLAALVAREDRVVRRSEIYRQVWGGEMKHRDRAVDVFVRKVRTKLAATAPDWRYIHTHFGVGYRFAPEHAPLAALAGDAEDAAL